MGDIENKYFTNFKIYFKYNSLSKIYLFDIEDNKSNIGLFNNLLNLETYIVKYLKKNE